LVTSNASGLIGITRAADPRGPTIERFDTGITLVK
jgi:hypothetical protein